MNTEQLRILVPALATELTGAKVAKIHQPADDTLILRLWTGRENIRLLICTGLYARIHLTEKDYPNPYIPPRFCQLLRARVRRITAVEQVNTDRIVRVDASGPDGICHLYIELFGRPGNVVLVGTDGRIVDALVRRRGGEGERSLLPGRYYCLPPKRPFSPDAAWVESECSSVDIRSLSRQLDEEYYPKQFRSGQFGDRRNLQQLLNREHKRLQRRIENIRRDKEQKNDFDFYRYCGQLLLANLHRFRKGMTEIEIEDHTRQPPERLKISLDPQLTPQGNAEALFRRYKKAKRGLDHVARRLRETEQELRWIAQLRHDLDQAQTPDDLREVADELIKAGLYRPTRIEPVCRHRLTRPMLNKTRSPGGFEVLWGRNNRANDHLTHRVAAGHDYWFHTRDVPGAHVVLRRDSDRIEVPLADMEFAATVAAAQSRRKNDGRVEVMCALVRDLARPKGGHPGQVLVPRFRSFFVVPAVAETEGGEDG